MSTGDLVISEIMHTPYFGSAVEGYGLKIGTPAIQYMTFKDWLFKISLGRFL